MKKLSVSNLLKRTSAIMMAALMLMTCWVFVSPQLVGGVDAETGYTYVITGTSGSAPEDLSNIRASINGASASISPTSLADGKSATFTITVTSDSLITSGTITLTYNGDKTDGSKSVSISNTSFTVNGKTISGASASGWSFTYESGTCGSGSFTNRTTTTTFSCPAETVDEVVLDAAPGNLTVPKTGSATTTLKSHAVNQYGKRMASSSAGQPTITISQTGVSGAYTSTTSTSDTSTITVTNSAKMQNADSATVSVTVKYGSKTKSTSFTLTDVSYTHSFNGNNGTISPSASITKKYYNEIGSSIPTSGSRVGYEYLAMYGSAKTEYSTTKPTVGTTSGYTGQLTTSTKIEGDKTWYAAWWAKNVKVTYLNNDGTVLKESDYGKYDKTAGAYAASAKPADPTYVTTPGVSGSFEYEFVRWEVVSAKKYTTANSDAQADYSDLVGQPYGDTVILKGDTVFQAIYRIASTKTYSVKYYDGGASPVYQDTHNYRDTATSYTRTKAADNTFTYTFKGWAKQASSTDYQYIYSSETGAFDDGGTHTLLTDFTVYDDMNLVAVYEKAYIPYTVNFVYTDRTENPDGTYSYTLAQNHETVYHYGDPIVMPVYEQDLFDYTGKVEGQANNKLGFTYRFNGWNTTVAQTATANVTYTAQYVEEAAEYQIKFVDYDGTVLNEGNTTFPHGADISAVQAAAYNALLGATYRDDDYEYAFGGWDKTVQMTATDNATYNAFYMRNPLYMVTYVNEGATVATWKGVAGETIPAIPNVETIDPDTGEPVATPLATPQKEGDDYAEAYVFAGWGAEAYDAKNPTEILVKADGTSVYGLPANGTTLYAQYTCTPTSYTVNFIYGAPDEDGVMPSHVQTLTYGDDVAVPTAEDVARPNDATYTYTFRGWDGTVSDTCTGDATYTALYRMGYVYYNVVWYQPDLTATQQTMTVGDETWVYYAPTADKVRPDETYIYNALISAPYQEPNAPVSDDPNYEYVLAGWLYKGTTDLLARSDRVVSTNHMSTTDLPENRVGKIELVPVFVLKANVKTVTFLDEDGTLLGTQKVPYGTELQNVNVGTLPAKSATETKHYTLDGWMLKNADNSFGPDVLAATYPITETITVKAKYSEKDHEFELIETTVAPTFFAEGEGELRCEACKMEGTVVLPQLTDAVAPIGRVKVKSDQWTDIADTESAVLTAAQSIFIVNTADSAAETTYYLNKATKEFVSELPAGAEDQYQALTYNVGGVGSQTGDIYLYAVKGTATPANVAEDDWYRCFNYAEYHQQNPGATEANFSATVGSIASEIDVADGETFVIYVKIVDRCGNISYISSAPLTYDGTPPEITITSTDGKDSRKHCVDATISVSAGDWFDITKNGTEQVSIPFDRTLREKGEYTITAYDEAGNVSRKVVEIIGSHNAKTIVNQATCTEPGSTYDICRTCGATISEPTETAPLGHNAKYRIKQPTCTVDGSVTVTCRRCGEYINNLVDGYEAEAGVYTGAILAQLPDPDNEGETFARLIATGEHTWGEWAVKKAATCSATGEKVRYCTKCNEEETETLPIDENAHRWSTTVYDRNHPATCTEPGWTYRVCRYNDAHEQKVADIEPTGHIADEERGWIQTVDPTCTEKGKEVQYCKYHDTVEVKERDVAPLGHDFSVFVATVAPTWNGDQPVQGYTTYKCVRCDATENRDYVDPVANVTVTFVVGEAETSVVVAKNSTLNTVTKPDTTKAADETYSYTFAGWKNGDTVVKDNYTIAEDVTLVATYTEHYVNYTVAFYKDDGTTRHYINGYAHYNDAVTVVVGDPVKDADATATYTFAGWKKAVKNEETNKWEPTGDIVPEIICKGDATYIAVFDATPITYTVIWADRAEGNYVAIKTLTVAGGSNVTSQNPALTGITLKTPNQNGHWVATGWDKQEEAANVTSDLVIRPIQEQVAHSYTTTTAAVSCTEPAKTIYTCACGYSYETTTGRPLGHNYSIEVSRVNPTADADGYKIMKCSRCGDQTNVTLPRIFLKITVKDNNHNAVSGVTVKVYDGDTYIGSGVSDSNGVATILVPEAKTYRIVIEGKEGSVTVNENGKITNSSIPTVDRDNGGNGGGNSGCDCTCHKSGFWPMIFRFFHKIIKLLTGEFRCCPDANY